jgi:hypothetical protein
VKFVKITKAEQEDIGVDSMSPQSPKMFFHNHLTAANASRRGTSHTHRHKVLLDILGLDAVDVNEAKQILKIRRNAV